VAIPREQRSKSPAHSADAHRQRVVCIHDGHDAWLDEYDRVVPALREHGEMIRAQLVSRLAEDSGLKLHSITLRVKHRDSVAAKLVRPDRTYGSLWELTDLVGLRVITYFEDGVDRVGRLLEAHLPVDFHHSVDKRKPSSDDRFGYRSLHYVCRLAPDAHAQHELRYEIQVRTLLEHAWAEIEHDLGYKSRDSVPAAARRRLNRLAGLLELADQEFVAIRRELADYATTLPARIASADEVALDRLSLGSLLDCDEVRELDLAIGAQLGRAVGGQPFFPGGGDPRRGYTGSEGLRRRVADIPGARAHSRGAERVEAQLALVVPHVQPSSSPSFLVSSGLPPSRGPHSSSKHDARRRRNAIPRPIVGETGSCGPVQAPRSESRLFQPHFFDFQLKRATPASLRHSTHPDQ